MGRAVLSVLAGRPLDSVAREIGVEPDVLQSWRDVFVDSGSTALADPKRAQGASGRRHRPDETRVRLLEATIECLVELGYAHTTTTEVARRAGLSRGAQLHHFPTKAELVVGAIEYLTRHRRAEQRRNFARQAGLVDSASETIDSWWPAFESPEFYAGLELLAASRTDPELAERLAPFEKELWREARSLFIDMLGDSIPATTRTVAADLTFYLMHGLALARIAAGDALRPHLHLQTWKRLMTVLLSEALPGTADL